MLYIFVHRIFFHNFFVRRFRFLFIPQLLVRLADHKLRIALFIRSLDSNNVLKFLQGIAVFFQCKFRFTNPVDAIIS